MFMGSGGDGESREGEGKYEERFIRGKQAESVYVLLAQILRFI